MNRQAGALFIALLVAAPFARAQDDFSFEILEGEVESADQARYDDAKQMLAEERYADALASYDSILGDKKMKKYHASAEYDGAKALYRMGLYHSALSRFTAILERGSKHEHYSSSREWLFFIARRMKDQRRVVALISQYADNKDLPKEYAAELHYQLARYHFLNALEDDAKREPVEAAPTEDSGDFNFTDEPAPPVETGDDSGEESSDDGGEEGGFDFSADDLGGGDDDGFTFDLDDVENPQPKKKKKKKKRKPRARPKRTKEPEPEPEPEAVEVAAPAPKVEEPVDTKASLKRALTHLDRIDESFALYAKSLYLKGLVYFALDDFEKAVDAFQTVVRMTNPRGGTVNNPKLREMAFFSLARIHYQFEQFRYAIFYYERIDRDSEAWLDALFESSWAHFRLGEYEKALGNLITIQSPFFLDEYYPESHILKAITFYENCRFPEARGFLDEFKGQYGGVMDELKKLIETNDAPEKVWSSLEILEKEVIDAGTERTGGGAITARVLQLVLNDKRLAVYRKAIEEVDAERERLAAIEAPYGGSPAHEALLKSLDARRVELVAAGGQLLGHKLKQELSFLKELSSKLVRIQFEITKQEKDALAARLQGERQDVVLEGYQFTTATDDERVYWPFEGEYWRDELGTYEYTLTRGCRPQSAEEG